MKHTDKSCAAAEKAVEYEYELNKLRNKPYEVIRFEDFEEFGSEREIRAHGKERLEGRDYVVQDGDIINIRFNV